MTKRTFAMAFVLVSLASPALAQPPAGGGRGTTSAGSGSSTGGSPAPGGGAGASGGSERAETQASGGAVDDDAEGDEDVQVGGSQRDVVEGGQRVRVFRFTGLDIAGRIRSPQLLYFLSRLRAEFDRPRLPHRSFMPELGRTTRGSAF